jgi:hypothetical protein
MDHGRFFLHLRLLMWYTTYLRELDRRSRPDFDTDTYRLRVDDLSFTS